MFIFFCLYTVSLEVPHILVAVFSLLRFHPEIFLRCCSFQRYTFEFGSSVVLVTVLLFVYNHKVCLVHFNHRAFNFFVTNFCVLFLFFVVGTTSSARGTTYLF